MKDVLKQMYQIYSATTTSGLALDFLEPGDAGRLFVGHFTTLGRLDKTFSAVMKELTEKFCDNLTSVADTFEVVENYDKFLGALRSLAPQLQKEFPDYDVLSVPEALLVDPAFADISWHNDVCPSFKVEATGETIFVDFPRHQADRRESQDAESPRFVVYRSDDHEDIVLETNVWSKVEKHVAGG